MPITTVTPSCSRELQLIADSIARSKRSIIVTGAGISTNAGIPDFRSQNGLYNLVKERYPNAVVKGRDLFDSILWSDPTSTAIFYTFLATLRAEVEKIRDSTPTHKFIKTLADTGRLLRCYTQNIDGLEERDGLVVDMSCGRGKRKRASTAALLSDTRTDVEKGCQVVQLHGNLRSLRCTQCRLLTAYTVAAIEILLSGEAPECEACKTASEDRRESGKRATKIGTLRPNVVLYGEEHPDADMVGSLSEADLRANPDNMIIMGTSLKVHGLKRLVKEAAKAVHVKGGKVIFVNNTAPTESVWNDVIDYYVQMDCDSWVTDLRLRRIAIFERQTRLPVSKVTKTGKATGKRTLAPEGDKENPPAKKRKISRAPAAKAAKGRAALGEANGNGTPTNRRPMLPTPSVSPSPRRRLFESDVQVFLSPEPQTPSRSRSNSRKLTGSPLRSRFDAPPSSRNTSSSPSSWRRTATTPPPTPRARQTLAAVEIVSPRKQNKWKPPAEEMVPIYQDGLTPPPSQEMDTIVLGSGGPVSTLPEAVGSDTLPTITLSPAAIARPAVPTSKKKRKDPAAGRRRSARIQMPG